MEGENKSDLSGDDDNEILSSTRIKQRRATVAPTAIPTTHLPRYLREGGRRGNNKTRRQSMPAQHVNNQPLPSIQLPPEVQNLRSDCVVESNEPTVEKDNNDTRIYPPKTPVKNSRSFPLDHRLQNSPIFSRYSYDSDEKMNTSSEGISASKGHHTSDLELTIFSRTPSPKLPDNHVHTLSPSSPSDKIRRHSIAVSKISDCNRKPDSHLPGMTDQLGKSESYLCKSRDRIISGSSIGDSESARNRPGPSQSRYVPKPDNHLFLSIFSCFCCPVIGLFAVIYSVQVDDKYEKGKKVESVTNSKNARFLALSAVSVGMMVIIGASLYGVAVFASAN